MNQNYFMEKANNFLLKEFDYLEHLTFIHFNVEYLDLDLPITLTDSIILPKK